MEIKIAYLYSHQLNLYGDRGNIIALCRRAEWRGIRPVVVEIGLGEKADLKEYDFIFLGGGSDREQQIITADLLRYKGHSLVEAVEEGTALLSICGGYQLLGQFYRTATGEEIKGIGLFNAYTVAGKGRLIGNIVIETEIDGFKRTIVGFENHSGRTYLGAGVKPMGRVLAGYGNNGEDGFEGAVYKKAWGTYLHGPLLPKNPFLADLLLRQALEKRYGPVELVPLKDGLETLAHERIVERFGKKKKKLFAGILSKI